MKRILTLVGAAVVGLMFSASTTTGINAASATSAEPLGLCWKWQDANYDCVSECDPTKQGGKCPCSSWICPPE